MEVVVKPKGAGKTTEAIKIANETEAWLVVDSHRRAKELSSQTKRFPVTFSEILNNKLNGSYARNVVIDDVDSLLQILLSNLKIEAVTLSNKIESELMLWQPIWTAPKDGTVVLLHFTNHDLPVVAWWQDDPGNPFEGEPTGSWWWDDGVSGRCEDSSQPTHWMYVPVKP